MRAAAAAAAAAIQYRMSRVTLTQLTASRLTGHGTSRPSGAPRRGPGQRPATTTHGPMRPAETEGRTDDHPGAAYDRAR